MKNKIISIFVCMLMTICIFSGVLNAKFLENTITVEDNKTEIEEVTINEEIIPDVSNELNINEDEITSDSKIKLTDNQMDKLDNLISNIKNYRARYEIRKKLSSIITNENEFDLKELHKHANSNEISDSSLNLVSSLVKKKPNNPIPCSSPTCTYFYPPYSSHFSSQACSEASEAEGEAQKKTGFVGAAVNAVHAGYEIGYGNAKGLINQMFYVGSQKTITVSYECLLSHGTLTEVGCVAGTDLCSSYDDYDANVCEEPLDEWWNWWTVATFVVGWLLTYFSWGGDIGFITILSYLSDIYTASQILAAYLDLYDLEFTEYTGEKSFTFTAQPGNHYIWIGVKATAVSYLYTQDSKSCVHGLVNYICINNYAAPDTPTVNGPSSGWKNSELLFEAVSDDPNNDKIKYKFSWGDGTSDWTQYVLSGQTVPKTHTYTSPGTYTINVWAYDYDRLYSKNTGTHTVTIDTVPQPPCEPYNENPLDDSEDVSIYADLYWECSDPNNDELHYNVFFGDTNPPPIKSIMQTAKTFNPGTLNHDTTYYWKITAYDGFFPGVSSPIWNFETIASTNQPPNKPDKPGAEYYHIPTGKEFLYWTEAEDPDGDDIKYLIDFDDESSPYWSDDWYESGDRYYVRRSWTLPGTYYVRALAKDTEGAISVYSEPRKIRVFENQGPDIPIITNLDVCEIDEPVQFNIYSYHPNVCKMRLGFDWKYYCGDGDPDISWEDEWINSGEIKTITKSFECGGYYNIAVKVMDEWGETSDYILHPVIVEGGEVDIVISETKTIPDEFIPYQKDILLQFTATNEGNRDGYDYDIFFTLDGECVHPGYMKRCSRIETEESQVYSWSIDWPYGDKSVHELGFHFGPVSDSIMKGAVDNKPPDIPAKPEGETSGKLNTLYAYRSSTIDINNHEIYYWFDWGDGTNSGWVGPYESGDTVEAAHSWHHRCFFYIKVKAKDSLGDESDWSEELEITMGGGKESGCPQGTQVTMDSGIPETKSIEEVVVGDWVKSYDPVNRILTTAEVIDIYEYAAFPPESFLVFNGCLEVTANHSMYINQMEWIEANDAQMGDFMLENIPGTPIINQIPISLKEPSSLGGTTYDLVIQPIIGEAVGYWANGILVGGYG